METKRAGFAQAAPVAEETGKSKRLSGLAIGAAVAAVTGVGATAGVVLNNVLGKKHYDLDDEDDELETDEVVDANDDNNTDEEFQEDTQNADEQPLPQEPEPKSEPNPEPEPEVDLEPLGWYTAEGPDGEEVYLLVMGDAKTGTPLFAIGESIPGSGEYDIVFDLTQDPVTNEPLGFTVTREELEDVMPNPDYEPRSIESDDIDDPLDGEDYDDDNDDNDGGIGNDNDIVEDDRTIGDDIIDDDNILIEDDDIIVEDDDIIVEDDDIIVEDDDIIVDDDDIIVDDDDIIVDGDEIIIEEDEGIPTKETVEDGPVDPEIDEMPEPECEIEEPYMEE